MEKHEALKNRKLYGTFKKQLYWYANMPPAQPLAEACTNP
jgi:hypothetical protein